MHGFSNRQKSRLNSWPPLLATNKPLFLLLLSLEKILKLLFISYYETLGKRIHKNDNTDVCDYAENEKRCV